MNLSDRQKESLKMKRLTEKQNGEYILPYVGENLLSISTSRNTVMIGDFKWVTTPNVTYLSGKFINKLGELEDVLEKYGIETTEELDGVLKPLIDNGELENWKSAIFWKTQTERLKQELDELKQKASVPKFKYGQNVWCVYPTNKHRQGFVFELEFVGYTKDKIICRITDNEEFEYDEVFATKEEAQAKLKELQGEKK